MKKHTQRAVVYIAGKLISQSSSSSIYSFKDSKFFSIEGTVTKANISIYDYELKCYVSGNGSSNAFSLYHFGNKKFIDLQINGKEFSGYDYDSGKHFSGNVNGNAISLYDYEFSQFFDFTL